MVTDQRRGPRTPGVVYSGVALAIAGVIAVVAVAAPSASPPTIAEFAPQAVERIDEAPSEQTSAFGDGPGGAGGGGVEPTPVPTDAVGAPIIDLPRVRSCVGDPPRQIEDPQSPPCVPYWEGDNGGATSRGVTASEVRVVVATCEGVQERVFQAFERFFNRRFEFYGRQMRFTCGQPGSGSTDPEVQTADARGDVSEIEPFAATQYKAGTGAVYSAEAARLGVVATTNAVQPIDHPRLWSYWMDVRDLFENLGEWACGRLVGSDAVHAGDPIVQGKQRRFGVIIETGYTADRTGPDILERRLAACGGVVAERSVNEFDDKQGDHERHETIVLRMQQSGVTSVFCFCHLTRFALFQVAATNQAYFPEWLVSTYGLLDRDQFVKINGNPRQQMENTFGVTFQPAQVSIEHEPWWWAVREVDPSYTVSNGSGPVGNATFSYRSILLLASGIQMAGPVLTPETFADGLARTRFPNPVHPNVPGRVGFERGRHTMMLDGAEIWWDPSAQPPYADDAPGTYCYVDGGRRRGRGTWATSGDPFFSGPCTTLP